MSEGFSFTFLLWSSIIIALAAFYYGFRMGMRAERYNWDLRRMVKPEKRLRQEASFNELELVINEQIGLWSGESNEISNEFCEKYTATTETLRRHVLALKRKSEKQWTRIRPVWQQMDFQKVTMAVCIEYDLSADKMLENLNNLLAAMGRKRVFKARAA